MSKEPIPFDESVYRKATSTRPGWANALIVAGVIFITWIVVSVFNGFAAASGLLLVAAVVIALVAGVMALTSVQRNKGSGGS